MKKIIIIAIVLIVVILLYKEQNNNIIIPDCAIRLRVIPNSNSTLDQRMKNKVKNYLENNTYSLLKDTDNIQEARNIITEDIANIEKNIDEIFKNNNYNMDYNVVYGYNYFPKKKYKGIEYKEGYYESLVISIGNAEGDNWWCVLFPNLCLIDTEQKDNKGYKIWVIETIKKYFK